MTILILKGEGKNKLFCGEEKLVTPFIGANGKGNIGLGAVTDDKIFIFWDTPRHVSCPIKMLRSLFVLSRAEIVDKITLSRCYELANGKLAIKQIFADTKNPFGSIKIDDLRMAAKEYMPTENELLPLLDKIRKHGVSIDKRGVSLYMKAHNIPENILGDINQSEQRSNPRPSPKRCSYIARTGARYYAVAIT